MIQFEFEQAPVASIVIVALRRAPKLLACLASVSEHVTIPYEVFVVLNDPDPTLLLELEHQVDGANVLPFRANLGFAHASNLAAERARGEYIVLLNDDCVVTPNWLEAMVDTARRREGCGVVGSTYLHPDGRLQEAGSILRQDGSTFAIGDGRAFGFMGFERRVDYCSGGSLLVDRDLWHALGGLDESYYPAYYEDLDFCLRAAEAGRSVWYQPYSVVIHHRGASTAPSLRSFILQRSRSIFRERWAAALEGRSEPLERAVWKAMGSPLRVLVIDDQVPRTAFGSGMGRMYDMLSALASDPGFYVSFHPRMPDAAHAETSSVPSGVRIVGDLEEHARSPGVGFDVVVISRPHNVQIFREVISRFLPGVPVIYDAEALFFRRLEMQHQVASNGDGAQLQADAEEMRSIETEVFGWADAVVSISEPEAEIVRASTSAPVHIVSPLLLNREPTSAGFDERQDIGFVAGWLAGPTSPNSDGLIWFVHEVLPLVLAEVTGCRLLVTGHAPPANVRRLEGPAVRFTGGLRDIQPFYEKIRVAISPTRFGAGVKLKTVEAIQLGVPVVTTPEGAAGLPAGLDAAVCVADDPAVFASSLVQLLRDRQAWERYRRRCLAAGACDTGMGVSQWPEIIRRTCVPDRYREAVR